MLPPDERKAAQQGSQRPVYSGYAQSLLYSQQRTQSLLTCQRHRLAEATLSGVPNSPRALHTSLHPSLAPSPPKNPGGISLCGTRILVVL